MAVTRVTSRQRLGNTLKTSGSDMLSCMNAESMLLETRLSPSQRGGGPSECVQVEEFIVLLFIR
jgi:hypothetical protein